MERTFTFSGEGPLSFDNTKSVKELIQYAFDVFGYEEPAGMEIVTLFQPGARTYTGWLCGRSLFCIPYAGCVLFCRGRMGASHAAPGKPPAN